MHFHLVCRELSVLCSFSSYLLCNWLSFPEYPYLSCCSTFQAQIIAYLLLLAIQSSHFFASITVALFVVVPRLSASTQLAIRSWVFCRCFAYKVGFAPAAPTFELCSSTRHFAFVRPMFSDLSLRITQSRRNAQLNWLTFVWTPACCRC